MKHTHLLAHLSFPVLFALAAHFVSGRGVPLSVEDLAYLPGALLFYALPHLIWAGFSAALKPALVVWHGGFVIPSCALLLIGGLSIWGPRDPSGLPYQWLVYWPLSGFLMAVLVLGWWFAGRPHAST